MATIDQFKSRLAGGGSRANQYRVLFTEPFGTGLDKETASYLCKATSLPGQTIPEVTVNFRGRQLFVAGDRTFETWTTTFINDTNFNARDAIERWMNGINHLDFNTGLNYVGDYSVDLTVQQLDRDDNILKQYILHNCWPTTVAPIELSYDTVSDIETFDVTWRYTHFTSVGV